MQIKKIRSRTVGLVVIAIAIATVSGCSAPGDSNSATSSTSPTVSTDVAAAGEVTLTVWDQNTQGGIGAATKQMNADFEAKYPNVTIDRVSVSFSDLKTTLKLALSSNTPPDVVQAGQGYPDMGAFIKANLLQNLTPYADVYGWNTRFSAELLDRNRFTSDGKTWHTGDLYGLVNGAQLTGFFYNKSILSKLGLSVPKTIAEFESAMAVAKKKGITPLSFGNLDKSPGIHLFGAIQNAIAGKEAVRDLVYNAGGKWTDASTLTAAQTLVNWNKKGYIPSGSSGIAQDIAVANFGNKKALFLLQGTWVLGQPLLDSSSTEVGFFVLNGGSSTDPVTMGGTGLPWSITSKSANPDVAAAYIDFVTGAYASQVLLDTGNFPALLPAGWTPKAGTLIADVAATWKGISDANGLTPWLDQATFTFYDTLSAAAQDLITGKKTPEAFTQTLQKDYAEFQSAR